MNINIRENSILGVKLNGVITRCRMIGTVDTISNKVVIERESDNRVFCVSPNLVAWVNEG